MPFPESFSERGCIQSLKVSFFYVRTARPIASSRCDRILLPADPERVQSSLGLQLQQTFCILIQNHVAFIFEYDFSKYNEIEKFNIPQAAYKLIAKK